MPKKKPEKTKKQKSNQKNDRPFRKAMRFWENRYTVQDSIPFVELYDDGISDLGNGWWSATYAFSDVNYTMTQGGEHIATFEKYCNYLNSNDETVYLQIHVNNKLLSRTKINFELQSKPEMSDELKTIIREHNEIHRSRASGTKSYVQEKYITIAIEESSYETARIRIDQLNQTALSALRSCGCDTHRLNKTERICLLREIYKPDDTSDIWNYDRDVTGESDKDLIAPHEIELMGKGIIRLGAKFVKPYFLADFPSTIDDNIIYRLTSMDASIFVTINIHPQNPAATIESYKKQLRSLDREKADNLRRQRKSGDPLPEVPRDLQRHMDTLESLLNRLETRNEKMFHGNVTFLLTGDTIEELEITEKRFQSRVLETNCAMKSFHLATEELFYAVLPLGRNEIYQFISRGFLTSEIASFIPFNVVELIAPSGILCGRNMLSNNVVMIDKRLASSGNTFLLGCTGSSKSSAAKDEIIKVMLTTNDDVIIIDVEGEFTKIVKMLGGTVIDIKLNGAVQVNPLDINTSYGADGDLDPVAHKADFILSLIDITVGQIDSITRSIADRVIHLIFEAWKLNPQTDNIPTFVDFYNELKNQPEQEAQNLAAALEIYVTGSLSIFSGKTTVNLDNRLVCFNLKNLGTQLRLMGMSIIQDYIWNMVTKNQNRNKCTRLYNDEIHYSLREPKMAAWLANCWKRGRKYGLLCTGITQQIEDITSTENGRSLLGNSQNISMFRQQPSDLQRLTSIIDLSEEQANFLLTCEPGTGLLKVGNSIIQVDNTIPKNTHYYKMISTTIGEDEQRC